MEIYQRHPVKGYTQLRTTDDGLSIEQEGIINQLRVEIPYEELLPVRTKAQTSFPVALTFFVALILPGFYQEWLEQTYLPWEEQIGMALLGFLMLGLCYFTYTRWRWSITVTTGWGNIVLPNRDKERPEVEQFVSDLRDHTKSYLYTRYALFDPFQSVEQQLEMYAWLFERKVITPEQLLTLQQQATRAATRSS
ncbi:hypothetical protein E5K00_08485 [Hymenobacter aquaticus]|uniref:Uncharacterized protein n=1 Tax=Hymenobacter aquaticus TaxID=1867101 RepID=A0A4Z0Q6Y5_9BACT|nr:hypothetical protein [Hymenobacter aquaticus]TGE25216.1 hypothetical protein E5K00_08485 [Hymenobacter aquaticus]